MQFTAHNIKLGNHYTIGPDQPLYADLPRTRAIVKYLKSFYAGIPFDFTVADLGCLEGGDSVALAREGFDVTGVEGKRLNFEKCKAVEKLFHSLNLRFIYSDARTFIKKQKFDVVMSMGMLYHLDRPVDHIRDLVRAASDIVVVKSHYCKLKDWRYDSRPGRILFSLLARLNKYAGDYPKFRFRLSRLTDNEGYLGRWFAEHKPGTLAEDKERSLWASLDNDRSFWLEKGNLMQALLDAGCQSVFQLYLGDEDRDLNALDYGVFIGLK